MSKGHAFINKWLMRVKEARTVLTVALWSIMALVQVLGFLRPYLDATEMIVVAVLMFLSGLSFTYLYDKLEFMKGENMQRVNRKNNFVGENLALDHMGLIHIFSEAFEKDEEEMMQNYARFIEDYREGIEFEEIEKTG